MNYGFFYYYTIIKPLPYMLIYDRTIAIINSENCSVPIEYDSMEMINESRVLEISRFIFPESKISYDEGTDTNDSRPWFYEISGMGTARARIEQFVKAIQKSTLYPIKKGIVKTAIIYKPFLRCSCTNGKILYTLFLELKLFDQHSIFVIIEEIPDKESNIFENTEQVSEFVDKALFAVRLSRWMPTSTYHYNYDDHCFGGNLIIENYILKNIVNYAYGIDLASIPGGVSMSFYGNKVYENILYDKNAPCSVRFDFYRGDVLFTCQEAIDYADYLNMSGRKNISYILINYLLMVVQELLVQENPSQKVRDDLKLQLELLRLYCKEEKIKLPTDLARGLENFKSDYRWDVADKLAGVLGKFAGNFASGYTS